MTSILDNLPYYTRVKDTVKSWLVPQELDFRKLSGGLMGVIITITLAEVDIYKMLNQNIRHGDLPTYTIDAFIIVTSTMEALLGPFLAWYGIRSKRSTLITWMSILAITSLTWLAIPDVNFMNNPENCYRRFIFTGFTLNSLTRLLILGVSSILFSLTRVVAFTHGAAHMDECDPKYISLHYGIFVVSRALPLLVGDKIFTTAVDDYSGSQRGLIIGSVINLVQIIQAIPKDNTSTKALLNEESVTESKNETDVIEKDRDISEGITETKDTEEINKTVKDKSGETDIKEKDMTKDSADNKDKEEAIDVKDAKETESVVKNKPEITDATESDTHTEIDQNQVQPVEIDFCSSLKRVLGNKLVMYQAVAMGLMAAALWGFGFNNVEIIKIKYFIDPRSNYDGTTEFIRYSFVLITVLYSATFFYPPIVLNEFLKKANKVAIIMSGVACVIYIIMVDSGDCQKGIVAGIDNDTYYPVGCGGYQCNPSWREFSPVCVPDSLLTFLSVREAGCVQQHEINGLMVYAQCACSATMMFSIATVGACSDVACTPGYQLHLMLFLGVVIVTTISLQMQGILVLRAVNPADKSIAVGVASSIVTICTFVVAHLAYNAIRENTCFWFEDERCHLQNEMFPYYVGYISAGLALLSLICSLLARRAINEIDEQKNKVTNEKKIN